MSVTTRIAEFLPFLEKTTAEETVRLFFVISFLLFAYVCVILAAPVVVFLSLF